MSTCKQNNSLSPLIVMIKEKMQIKSLHKVMKKLKKSTILSKKELTVQELISSLKKLPQNVKVVIDAVYLKSTRRIGE